MVIARRKDLDTSQLTPGWEGIVNSTGLNDSQIVPGILNFSQLGGYSDVVPMDRLYNATYEKFTSTVRGNVAELLVNLAERKEALKMVHDRLVKIINAARAFRQFQFGAAARYLGVVAPTPAQQKRWGNPRQWGADWLEWHFGWSPTIGDIYSAVEILDGAIPTPIVTESSSWKLDRDWVSVSGSETKSEWFRGQAYCKMSSGIEVSDLTLLKANQLGLINPATVVWELIPFSFLADWFGTIGLWLRQFTDFLGLTLHWPQHVYFIYGEGRRTYKTPPAAYGTWSFGYTVTCVKRRTGAFPGPTLALRPYKGLSVTRGLTAISLILGIFAPH